MRYQEVFNTVQPCDNVVIEEYEAEYEKAWLFSKKKITIPYHRIVRIERGGQLIYPADDNATLQTPRTLPTPAAPLEGTAAFGTGFFVSNEGHFLTCYHVIKDARGIEIITFDRKRCTGEVIQVDPANDLALLKVDIVSRGITLSESSGLARGEEVLTLGYPLIELQGQGQKATFGRINSISGMQGDIRFIQIDVPIQPGNSGGPLMNKKGDVVGIVTSTINSLSTLMTAGHAPQNVNYAVKSDYALPLIRTYVNGKTNNVISVTPNANFADTVKQNAYSVALVIVK